MNRLEAWLENQNGVSNYRMAYQINAAFSENTYVGPLLVPKEPSFLEIHVKTPEFSTTKQNLLLGVVDIFDQGCL